MNKILISLFILFSTTSLCFGKGLNPEDTLTGADKTTLDGHRFVINSVIGSPFLTTHLQNNIGGGQTVDLKIPPLVIDSQEVLQLQGDLVFTNINIEYQQAVRDWMAFRVKFLITGRLGTETGALMSQGINVATGFELGWIFKLYQSKKFLMSGSIDLSNNSYTVADLNKFIQGVIDSGAVVKSNKLIDNVPTIKAGGSFRASYAFNKMFGFTGNINAQFGEAYQRDAENKWYLEYGGGFDANLLATSKVPLGFFAGFYHNAVPLTTEQIISEPNNVLFQVNYTGKKDLNLGLELNYQFYKPLGFENTVKFVTAALQLRYFF